NNAVISNAREITANNNQGVLLVANSANQFMKVPISNCFQDYAQTGQWVQVSKMKLYEKGANELLFINHT
ncbi:hypothetical protein, partial [Pseudoalteromonas sp.]|uniref:hypothetical protein n=1 Tax=Pseudoalteromonas sp. TaxID=53249 RepID=UPI00272C1CF7